MSIIGTTNTCLIIGNDQFTQSGLTESNLDAVTITDLNGVDVAQCYGITSQIINLTGSSATITGTCDTSLEISITTGILDEVTCDYIDTDLLGSGLVLLEYSGGVTTLNVHPDCCTSLGYEPEIGPDMYYVCRWRGFVDPTDCNNYLPRNEEDGNGYQVFDYVTGGTTTILPSAECCGQYGFIDSATSEGIRCIIEVIVDPCSGLVVIEPAPLVGDIPFLNPVTNLTEYIVPTSECCSSNGFNFRPDGLGFICYNSLTVIKPILSITNDACCVPLVVLDKYQTWAINLTPAAPVGSGVVVTYLNCAGVVQQETVLNPGNAAIPFGLPITIQAKEVISIFGGNVVSGDPYITSDSVSVNWGIVYKAGTPQNC